MDTKESLFQISHEIKNSLAVMKGYMALFDGSIEKYQKYMPYLEKSLDHSIELLSDFKDIGNLDLDLDILDINYLLEEIIKLYKPILLDKGIKFRYRLEEELFVEGDYKRLKQVFINILKNSIEATQGRDDAYINIETSSYNNEIIIIFKDNGIGMDDYTLKNVFKPFYTTKKYGTGLGMYISKEIITKHGGNIECISNKGVCIKIKLNQYLI